MRTVEHWSRRALLALAGLPAVSLRAAEEPRPIPPTFLKRRWAGTAAAKSAFAAPGVVYRPLFGEHDADGRYLRSVSRYGLVEVDAGSATQPVKWDREETAYVVLSGAGRLETASPLELLEGDFFFIPPGTEHRLRANKEKLRAVVMSFRLPASVTPAQGTVQKANLSEVKKQVVGNHPPSTLYQLMIGDRASTRDRIAAGQVLTSLFVMEFAPGGTNFPHAHDREEEIYLLLEGRGDMVAGSGTDGVAGRFPATPGDAYFVRLNCTVGFYNESGPAAKTARILAVRSLYPFR